jgi:chromosomal replication initiation ATPase DnaA
MTSPLILEGGFVQIDSSSWSQIKLSMKTKFGSNRLFETYLDPIDLIGFEQSETELVLTLGVPNRFFLYYVNENLKEQIHAELKTIYNVDIHVNFVITEKVTQ